MIAIILTILFLSLIIEGISIYSASRGIQYQCYPDQHRVEVGESFSLYLKVSNRKLLPVPFVKIEEKLPLEIAEPELAYHPSLTKLNHTTQKRTAFLGSRQSLVRKIPVNWLQRGTYTFPGADITTGDFLGLYNNDMTFPQYEEILVYPPVLHNPNLTHAMRLMIGEIVVNSLYLEDPSLVAGYRDYTGREPMRSISWPMSARLNRLTVKDYDHTRQLSATVILDNYCPFLTSDHRTALEYCYQLIRTFCEEATLGSITYQFFTNSTLLQKEETQDPVTSSLPGNGQNQRTLEILSRCTTERNCNLEALVRHIAARKMVTNCYLIMTPIQEPRVSESANLLHDLTGVEVRILSAEEYLGKEVQS